MQQEKKTIGQRLAHWMLDHRLITIALVVIPTLVLAYSLPTIEVYSRFADLLPEKHEYIKNYNRMKQTFGGANVVTMSLQVEGEGDIFTYKTLNKIKHLTEEVDLIQGVNHYQVASIAHPKIRRIRTTAGGLIKSEPVLPREVPQDAEALKQLREESFNNDIVYGTYISADGTAALILAGFDEERLDYNTIFTRLKELKDEVEADGETKLYIAGEPMLKGWIYYHSGELTKIFGITAAVMIVLLYLHFGSLAGVFVPLLGTGMSAIWGLGFVGWMGYNLDPLILVVPILISARTASHCVQMMERFHDEIRLGATREAAVRTSMGELIVPAAIAIFMMMPPSTTSVLVFAAMIGLFWLGTVPVTSALVMQMFGLKHASMLLGVVFLSHQLGSFLGAWIGGYVFELSGSYDLVWWISVGLGVAAAALHWPIDDRPIERPAPAERFS